MINNSNKLWLSNNLKSLTSWIWPSVKSMLMLTLRTLWFSFTTCVGVQSWSSDFVRIMWSLFLCLCLFPFFFYWLCDFFKARRRMGKRSCFINVIVTTKFIFVSANHEDNLRFCLVLSTAMNNSLTLVTWSQNKVTWVYHKCVHFLYTYFLLFLHRSLYKCNT